MTQKISAELRRDRSVGHGNVAGMGAQYFAWARSGRNHHFRRR